MTSVSEPTLCPKCGWTGTVDENEDVKRCPVCETVIGVAE